MCERAVKAWGNFDAWADRLIRGEVSFDVFARNVKSDVSRMAWAATKRRRPPYWMGIEDVEGLILQHVWYYAFQHKSRDGHVGYDASRSSSAGGYLRWNAAQHVQKDIGKARGENMHAHRLDGPAPETLSKTGESPEPRELADEEHRFDDGRKNAALARITEATRSFVVQNEVLKTFNAKDVTGAKERVVSFLMRQPKEVRDVLGIVKRKDAARFWWMFANFGLAKDAVLDMRALAKGRRREAPSEPEPVAPLTPARHPKEDAFSCEEHILVEENVIRPARSKKGHYHPNRSDMIVVHGNLRSFRLGCRCPECRGAKRREWVVWETRKQAREKEAALS